MRFEPETTEFICFNCANLFTDMGAVPLICPECGDAVDRTAHKKLLEYAADAVEYGYHYRQIYEEDLEQGEIESANAIVFDDIWIFVALAGLSGVIGNATYDAIKLVIRKISERRLALKADQSAIEAVKEVLKLIDNEQDFALFLQYLVDYYNLLNGTDRRVRNAMLQELVIDRELRQRYGDRFGSAVVTVTTSLKPTSTEILIKAVIENRPHSNDFDGFWKKIK